MEQNKSATPFLTKTYQIVDDPETDGVVSWGKNGKTFVVWKTDEFANDLLPKHFKHRNLSSFVRQLNTYGFRKVMPDRWEFANNFFQKGKPELISQIRRKTPALAATSSGKHESIVSGGGCGGGNELMSTSTSVSLDNSTGNSSHHHRHQSQQQPTDLTNENLNLRRENEHLSCELARTRKQCDGLAAFLTKTLKIGSDHIGRIMHMHGGACHNKSSDNYHDDDDDDEKDQIHDQNSSKTKFVVEEEAQHNEGRSPEEEATGFKLFGVLLRNCNENEDKSRPNKKKKRAREENVPINASYSYGCHVGSSSSSKAAI